MIKLLIVSAVLIAFLVFLYLVGTADDRKAKREYKAQHKITPEQKRMLTDYEDLVDELRALALDHMDVDPFARIVFDTIRTKEKEIGR